MPGNEGARVLDSGPLVRAPGRTFVRVTNSSTQEAFFRFHNALFAASTLEMRWPNCDATRRSMFKPCGATFDYFARTADCRDPHEMGTLRVVEGNHRHLSGATVRTNRPLMNAQGERKNSLLPR